MIRIRNLTKSFGEKVIFDNFDLKVDGGQMLAIVGESGSGKSTLLNIIGFIEGDYSGDYFFKDYKNVKVNSKESQRIIRDEISYLFQDFALIEDESVRDNLKLALKYISKNKSEKEEIMKDALRRVNMEGFLDKKVASLSGGEQQRISLARAIIKPSSLILADEPTGSLDEGNAKYVMDLLEEINESGKTIIIVTHDKYCASRCQRIVRLK
ncbi:MAG: ABC transporter ATP-binding protein [Anaerococcus sp.]|nr:ABC transporter ATP-binding protein [Anaerococcus sp.]